MNSRQSNSTSN